MDGWAEERQPATHLKVTPNLHALVGQYAMSDNYFVDSDVSADGHRWVVGIDPTPFFNTAWTSGYGGAPDRPPPAPPARRWGVAIAPPPFSNPAWSSGYAGRRHASPGASQPGRRAMFGGADAPM